MEKSYKEVRIYKLKKKCYLLKEGNRLRHKD